MNQTEVEIEVGIAMISKIYQLDAVKVTRILQKLDSITHEQRETILAICTAFKVKDIMDSQLKSDSQEVMK